MHDRRCGRCAKASLLCREGSNAVPRVSKQLGHFKAKDPHGKVHVVYARQDFNVAHGDRGVYRSPAGPMLLNLADGTAVIRLRKGEYEVTVGKVRLTSFDDAAV
jgi:hypothetical protein